MPPPEYGLCQGNEVELGRREPTQGPYPAHWLAGETMQLRVHSLGGGLGASLLGQCPDSENATNSRWKRRFWGRG